ncbi:MAG: restriction endonuclease subunit S [Acutalibacteraceae bacterium]
MKSDKTTPNVPTLRFPNYNGEWQKTVMGKVCSFRKGYGIAKDDLSRGGTPCILYGELYTTYKTAIAKTIKSKTSIQSKSLVYSQKDDVIIPCSGETAEDIATSICVPYDGVLLGGDLTIVHSDLDGAFLSNQINSVRKFDIARIAQGKSIVHLQADELKKIFIFYPSIQEQRKISAFIDKIDERIEIQNKIISKYETLIKGICFRLLSKIEEYPTVKLSEILTEYCDKTSKNNEFPILSSTMSGIYVQSEYFNKQAACEENVGYKKIPYGYCTYRSMSDTGEFRFNIQKTVQMGIVSPAYPVFTSTIYDIDFVAFYLNKSTRLRKQIIEAKEGGTRFALLFSKLSNLTIPKIAKQQQTKMIEIYHAFLRKEDIERDYLNKLREQKSYLLSKMFI